MARSVKRLVYMEPELHAAIKKRADEMGLSVNEWINRVAESALASKGIRITYHHRIEVEV
jgi:predicted HicB family RNase H-like nuclease